MKIIFPMIMTSMFLFGIDCSKIDIEAERILLENSMDIISDLKSDIRTKQRKEAKEFSKCLLFQDLNADGYSQSEALFSLSKLSLTSGEKELFLKILNTRVNNLKAFNFPRIDGEKGNYLLYSLWEDTENKNNFLILSYLLDKQQINEVVHSVKKEEYKKLICMKDEVTRRFVENDLAKKFQCEIPASKKYYGVYNLSKINNYIPVGKTRLNKGTDVKIVTATNQYVTFKVMNAKVSKSYKMNREYFDKYFSQTYIKKGK